MTFNEWLTKKKIVRYRFAKELGISAGYLTRLANGERKPGRDLAFLIEAKTAKAVKAIEWSNAA